jgi:hypothetical protein
MTDPERAILSTVILSVFLLGACGDTESTDTRQWYTKAPIEDPGLTITPEVPSEMAGLGEPDLMGVGAQEEEAAGPASPPPGVDAPTAPDPDAATDTAPAAGEGGAEGDGGP